MYGSVVDMINKVESIPSYNDIRKRVANELSISAGLGPATTVVPFQPRKSSSESDAVKDVVVVPESSQVGR